MDAGGAPPDAEMEEAAVPPAQPPHQPPSAMPGIESNIQATLSHGGRFIQYNIFGNIFEVSAKYRPPILPIGKGAYGIVWYYFSLCLSNFLLNVPEQWLFRSFLELGLVFHWERDIFCCFIPF
jgi:hypothetical protein